MLANLSQIRHGFSASFCYCKFHLYQLCQITLQLPI